MTFLFMKTIARKKLVEKHIDWKQVYTQKTKFLKDMFEDVIGPGSYFRFEGVSSEDNVGYYCIIGPAKIHAPIAKFFAGVRRLPATFSAGGKYFDSMDAAAQYAEETWGVKRPKELRPYNSGQLKNIRSRVEKWREDHEEEENQDDE